MSQLSLRFSLLMSLVPLAAPLSLASPFEPVSGVLDSVSVGPSGVWATNRLQEVWYRNGTYNQPEERGTIWHKVQGIKLEQLDVGRGVVWGRDHNHNVYYRQGLSCERPHGSQWRLLHGLHVKHITVSPRGFVWAVHPSGDVYYRLGASNSNHTGGEWQAIPGRRLTQISAGKAGIWGVELGSDEIVYRIGTFGDNGSLGMGWITVPGKLRSISSGDSRVVGVSAEGEVFVRKEMFSGNPTGMYWRRVSGQLTRVDTHGDDIWGVNNTDVYFYSDLLGNQLR